LVPSEGAFKGMKVLLLMDKDEAAQFRIILQAGTALTYLPR
jgi:hypothetical protein